MICVNNLQVIRKLVHNLKSYLISDANKLRKVNTKGGYGDKNDFLRVNWMPE